VCAMLLATRKRATMTATASVAIRFIEIPFLSDDGPATIPHRTMLCSNHFQSWAAASQQRPEHALLASPREADLKAKAERRRFRARARVLAAFVVNGIRCLESPVVRTFTLGNFFDVWGQELEPDRVGPASGHVTAIYNDRLFEGNPRQIPLTAHAQIQLDVGGPLVVPLAIAFPAGL
jgi:hypothetical protein